MLNINSLAFTIPLPTVLFSSSGINGFSYLLTPTTTSGETPEPATGTLIGARLLLA